MKKFLSLFLASVFALTSTVALTGCSAQSEAVALLAAAGPAVSAVVLAINPSDSATATKITADFKAASAAVAAFKKGTPCQDVMEALTVLQADLNLLPLTGKYAAVLAVAIAGVQSVLAVIPACAPLTAKMGAVPAKVMSPKEFKKEWNAQASKFPELSGAMLK